MKFNKLILVLTFLTLVTPKITFAQVSWKMPEVKIMGIPFKTIAKMVNDKEGVYYYPELLKKYQKLDTTSLYTIDYIMLYYGFVTQKGFHPYKQMTLEDSLTYLNETKQYKKAKVLSQKLLKTKPISFIGNIERGTCLYELEDSLQAFQCLEKFNRLFYAVEGAGRGNSIKDPIVLISTLDVSVFIRRYQLKVLESKLEEKEERKYLFLKVVNPDKVEFPIYFDVSIPYYFSKHTNRE